MYLQSFTEPQANNCYSMNTIMLSGEYIKLESNDCKTLIDGDLLNSFLIYLLRVTQV